MILGRVGFENNKHNKAFLFYFKHRIKVKQMLRYLLALNSIGRVAQL